MPIVILAMLLLFWWQCQYYEHYQYKYEYLQWQFKCPY
jgi:hypothetical protein